MIETKFVYLLKKKISSLSEYMIYLVRSFGGTAKNVHIHNKSFKGSQEYGRHSNVISWTESDWECWNGPNPELEHMVRRQ